MLDQSCVQNLLAGLAGEWNASPSASQRHYQATDDPGMEIQGHNTKNKNFHVENP
jgi:hypothetical protein